MASVIYGKCYLWQMYYGKCNYGKNIYGKNIMANETEPIYDIDLQKYRDQKFRVCDKDSALSMSIKVTLKFSLQRSEFVVEYR